MPQEGGEIGMMGNVPQEPDLSQQEVDVNAQLQKDTKNAEI